VNRGGSAGVLEFRGFSLIGHLPCPEEDQARTRISGKRSLFAQTERIGQRLGTGSHSGPDGEAPFPKGNATGIEMARDFSTFVLTLTRAAPRLRPAWKKKKNHQVRGYPSLRETVSTGGLIIRSVERTSREKVLLAVGYLDSAPHRGDTGVA